MEKRGMICGWQTIWYQISLSTVWLSLKKPAGQISEMKAVMLKVRFFLNKPNGKH